MPNVDTEALEVKVRKLEDDLRTQVFYETSRYFSDQGCRRPPDCVIINNIDDAKEIVSWGKDYAKLLYGIKDSWLKKTLLWMYRTCR
jgi:hypothetical protein